MVRLQVPLVVATSLAERPRDDAGGFLALVLHEVSKAEFGRGENVGFKRLSDELPVDFHPAEINPAWDVLEQVGYAWETFPFAIGRNVCFPLSPSRIQ